MIESVEFQIICIRKTERAETDRNKNRGRERKRNPKVFSKRINHRNIYIFLWDKYTKRGRRERERERGRGGRKRKETPEVAP